MAHRSSFWPLPIATTARAGDPECPSQPLSLDVPEPPSVELRELPNIGALKRQAVNYKCFGQYDKDVTAVLSGAREYVESYVQLVAGKETKLAIVLDIDETALSNWPVIRGDDFAFIKKGDCGDLSKEEFCGWVAWQARAEDKPIEPTLELFNASKAKGVTVFFITVAARSEPRATTEANLKAAGYVGWEDKELIMRPEECPHLDTVAVFKAAERAKIEKEGYTIIANVGDQWSRPSRWTCRDGFQSAEPVLLYSLSRSVLAHAEMEPAARERELASIRRGCVGNFAVANWVEGATLAA